MNIGREIEQLRKRAAKMEAAAEYFIECRKRLDRWAYFGDSANDPAEDPQVVAAIAGLDHVISRARAAKRQALAEASDLQPLAEEEVFRDALDGFGQ